MNTLPFLRAILFVAVILAVPFANTAPKKSPPEKPGDLRELSKALPPVGSTFKLSPEWIGTVRRVHTRGGRDNPPPVAPADLRLTHARVAVPQLRKDAAPFLEATRATKDGVAPEISAVFVEKLPRAKDVEGMTLKEIRKRLGPQLGGTLGWGGTDGMHWTESWTCFTIEAPRELRYLRIFTRVHGGGAADATIDFLEIREGIFKPATPVDPLERLKFKTQEDADAEREKHRLASLAKFPEPLRSLLEAYGRPDDSDLVTYTKLMNAARTKPDQKLITQMVAALADDDTMELTTMFHAYFGTEDGAIDLTTWKKTQKAQAQRHLFESLAAARSPDAFETALVTLLGTMGGGEVELELEEGVNVEVKVPEEGGYQSGSQGIEPENLKAVVAATQKHLREEYPRLFGAKK